MITSYREVPLLPIEHAEAAGTLREISISAPPGAVFDPEANVALPASAGSFAYRYNIDSQFHQSRNRFITWCALCCSTSAHLLEAHPRPNSRFSRALARFELGEEHTASALPLRSRSRNLLLRVDGGPQPYSGKTMCASPPCVSHLGFLTADRSIRRHCRANMPSPMLRPSAGAHSARLIVE